MWPVIREGFLEEEELCLQGERNWPGEGADEVLGPHCRWVEQSGLTAVSPPMQWSWPHVM